MSFSKKLLEEYKDAFENKQGMKLLTQSEAKFIRAYMKLNRTNNEQKERPKNKD